MKMSSRSGVAWAASKAAAKRRSASSSAAGWRSSARSLVGDRPRRGLEPHRRRDRPAVVDAEQDDRGTDDAGKVGRLVEVALRRRAIPEVAEDGAGLAAEAQAPRQPDGVRDLGGDG